MIQIEIIENENELALVNDVNFFLEQLEEHLFVDLKYANFSIRENGETKIKYSALILYRVL